ncbi:HWE histidine kinase domain-containing protein [Euryhalocaulis caribicus]|uniref:HWE histidine kinase domain-containing protein n=1 Tax=Euryhalocaulis caribicus TaxID=1161401 RepID=UPI0003A1F9DE|nr:HWE histidine kinase domain-containing protein [Euryhalocaulis caribicus]
MSSDKIDFISPSEPVDLTNCDREPIHLLGRIQPFGFLLGVTSDWVIEHASESAAQFLGQPLDALFGAPLKQVFAEDAIHAIRGRLQLLGTRDATERIFGRQLQAGGAEFDLALHMSGGRVIIEAEPSEKGEHDPAATVSTMVSRLSSAKDAETLARMGARHLRALTGFDRVMVYRFSPDGSGEVLAEAARGDLESYLGLHYPASDIPKQARELYKRNLLRLIADVDAETSPLRSAKGEDEPLDLSLSVLRSVSPIHIEYLKNIGVGASMSVSILRRGKLWGLFACHHMSPKRVPFDVRTAAELFGQAFALLLDGRERDEAEAHERRARKAHDRLMAAAASGRSSAENIASLMEEVEGIVDCDGIALEIQGRRQTSGLVPEDKHLEGLIALLKRESDVQIMATDRVSDLYPPAEGFSEKAAGMLAIPISRAPRDFILFFRREVVQTVSWGGDPNKPVESGPLGDRLTPRQSFEEWKQVVRGKGQPWTERDIRIAESLRVSLLEVILRLTEAAETERKEANQRQEMLIAELNHRVRNILSLIRGLIAQSRAGAKSMDELVAVIGGRIQALARAHDQLTQDNWSPRPLSTLIKSEAEAYLGDKEERVRIEGPQVAVEPAAFSTLALVVHELMTNSAKYGALSDSTGAVDVNWEVDGEGNLVIGWKESGGPPVQAPSRKGFGTTIIERSVPFDLKGEAEVNFELTGLEAKFRVPKSHITKAKDGELETRAEKKAAQGGKNDGKGETLLSGTVLLLEDNMVIALDAEDMLTRMGAQKVEVAASASEALRLIEANTPDAAVLDVNLGDENSFPVADRLKELGVPYIFATGYGEESPAPDLHLDRPFVRKPYSEEGVREALSKVSGG